MSSKRILRSNLITIGLKKRKENQRQSYRPRVQALILTVVQYLLTKQPEIRHGERKIRDEKRLLMEKK